MTHVLSMCITIIASISASTYDVIHDVIEMLGYFRHTCQRLLMKILQFYDNMHRVWLYRISKKELDRMIYMSWILKYSIFQTFGSRWCHDLLNQYIFSFHNRYEYCKIGALDIYVNFSRFFERGRLDHFHEYKMPMVLYNGKTRSSILRLP